MSNIEIRFKKLYEDSQDPLHNEENAGIDLYTHHIEDNVNYIKVFTGIAIEPEEGFFTVLVPRSSIFKSGLVLYNSLGIIDNSYRGELIGIFLKTKDFLEIPKKGSRLLQLVIHRQINAVLTEVDELSSTDRGSGGFGSSGK